MNLGIQFANVILFLEKFRKGFRYSISISKSQQDQWICSIHGESKEDKSRPFDFTSCSSSDFDSLPFLIEAKARDLLKKEIESNISRILEIQNQNKKLEEQFNLISELKNNLI